MVAPIEVRMPMYPECWDTCGNCGQGEVIVLEVLVQAGETIREDDNIITLETGKVALDIPSPHGERIVDVSIKEGDHVEQGALILTLAPE